MSLRSYLESLQSKDDLQRLFVEVLNFGQESSSVISALSPKIKESVKSAGIIAGQQEFKIIHCELTKLLKGNEKPVIEQLSNYYPNNLIVFSNARLGEFHFTSLRPITKKKRDIIVRDRPIRRIVIGPDERLRTADERLSILRIEGDETALQVQAKCDEAFNVEAVSRQFYKDFVYYYKQFREVLIKRNKIKENLADEFTQTIFNRFFFLYFIQKKGYLNGDTRYLYHQFRNIGKQSYYEDIVLPLFQKLSIPDFKAARFGSIPFLNGGLFEFSEAEKKLQIPNDAFQPIFDGLFEYYNFTIREDTEFEKEVAIDPEMMGTIFEQMILGLESKKFEDIPDPRRASGSYYTPKFIVAFMVKETLLNDLVATVKDIPRQKLKQLIFNLKTDRIEPQKLIEIKERLKQLKVVDPGVGSGAYAVGILLKIVEIIETIDRVVSSDEPEKPNYRHHLKEFVIENCIYGVDIQERAVNLAKLRLWLSLSVDLEIEEIKDIPPLPNLDYHILCGDSLISQVAGYSFEMEKRIDPGLKKSKELLDKYIKQKKDYQRILPKEEKEKARKEIAETKRDILIWFLTELRKTEERKLAAYEGKQTAFFDEDTASKQPALKVKEEIREQIKNIDEQLKDVDSLSRVFNWGLDFFEVLEMNGGFDIVIANPPYGVKVEDRVRKEFGVDSKDSYGVFTVLGLRILKPGGTLCYIMSDTWQTIRSHKKLRNILLLETDAQYLISLPADVFQATVNTGVYAFIKREAKRNKWGEDADNWILAADFSPLRIRQPDSKLDSSDLEAAFELLIEKDDFDESKDGYTIVSDREMAIFAYRQKLIPRFSNHSFFIASPKLFGLMRDVGNIKNLVKRANEPTFYNVDFNSKELNLVKLGNVSEIRHGLTTGNTKKFIFKNEEEDGPYKIVDEGLVFEKKSYTHLSKDEMINGVFKNKHNGKFIFEYDKGGKSISTEGWLPKYYVRTGYYINWSREAVKEMKRLPGFRHDGRDFYFIEGITFSHTGIYSPTFRKSSGSIFDTAGSCIFPNLHGISELLGLLNSKLILLLFKSFINHSVNTSEDPLKLIPIVDKVQSEISRKVNEIIDKQMNNQNYDYVTNEQIEIDLLVYQMYNLNAEDIQEVENWYFRRYPKLARAIEEKLKKKEQAAKE